MKPAGDKLKVFCRQFAKVESLKDAEGEGAKHKVCVLSNFKDHVHKTVGEWQSAFDKIAAGAGAAKDALDKGGDDKGGDDKGKDDAAPKEGEDAKADEAGAGDGA